MAEDADILLNPEQLKQFYTSRFAYYFTLDEAYKNSLVAR
jgi:hypothetical protein